MPTKYPKRTLKKNLNREKLIVVATQLFSRNGHQSTTLDEVATEAGVHVQTLYKHFKTKEELVTASAEIVVTDCRARFEDEVSEPLHLRNLARMDQKFGYIPYKSRPSGVQKTAAMFRVFTNERQLSSDCLFGL